MEFYSQNEWQVFLTQKLTGIKKGLSDRINLANIFQIY